MNTLLIGFPTADDYAAILLAYPKGARGRRHLEQVCREKRREQMRREWISHILTCTAEMMRDLEAEIDAEFALSPSGKEG